MTGMHCFQVNSVMNLGLVGVHLVTGKLRFQIFSGPNQQLDKFQVSYLIVDMGLLISGEFIYLEYFRFDNGIRVIGSTNITLVV
jgi:hypothetical protein